jgi:hypothetical protein
MVNSILLKPNLVSNFRKIVNFQHFAFLLPLHVGGDSKLEQGETVKGEGQGESAHTLVLTIKT